MNKLLSNVQMHLNLFEATCQEQKLHSDTDQILMKGVYKNVDLLDCLLDCLLSVFIPFRCVLYLLDVDVDIRGVETKLVG